MKKFMMGAAALALLAGCGPKDKPASPTDVALKELTTRAGNPAKAADALAAMSLTGNAGGVLSFADKNVDGANATFSNISILGEQGVNAGSLVLEGLDMADGNATFGKISLNDIVISDDSNADNELKLGNIELTNPSAQLATWLTASLNGQDATLPAVEDIKFDSWSMNNLSASFDENDTVGVLNVAKVEIRDMDGTKAALAKISGITMNGMDDQNDTPIKFNLGSISLSNVDAKFVRALQETAGDESAMAAALMDVINENPMDPGYDGFALDDLSFEAAGAFFDMPSMAASVERNAAGQPVKYVTNPFEMTLKADAEGGEAGAALLQGLSMVGYESLTVKGQGSANYDPDKDILSYDAKSNYLQLVDGVKISFGGKIEGYSAYNKEIGNSFNFADMADGAEPDPEAMMAAAGKLIFHSIELSIDDDSLLDRAFNAAATAQGQDPAEMKSQISMGLAMAPMMAQGMGVDMELVTEATGALGKFISDGGTLTLKVNPATPLAIADIMANPDPAAYTKQSLGFSATQK